MGARTLGLKELGTFENGKKPGVNLINNFLRLIEYCNFYIIFNCNTVKM